MRQHTTTADKSHLYQSHGEYRGHLRYSFFVFSRYLRALHTTSSGITWIISGYYLGSAIAQPVMGKLGDAFGRARFVYIGFALMVLTAVMAPLSNALWLFVLWRVVQAIGTSMIRNKTRARRQVYTPCFDTLERFSPLYSSDRTSVPRPGHVLYSSS